MQTNVGSQKIDRKALDFEGGVFFCKILNVFNMFDVYIIYIYIDQCSLYMHMYKFMP